MAADFLESSRLGVEPYISNHGMKNLRFVSNGLFKSPCAVSTTSSTSNFPSAF